MTSCRWSRDLLDTRNSSPWTWALTPLGPSSRMIFAIFLAFSWLRPDWKVPLILYSLPDRRGSSALEGLQ